MASPCLRLRRWESHSTFRGDVAFPSRRCATKRESACPLPKCRAIRAKRGWQLEPRPNDDANRPGPWCSGLHLGTPRAGPQTLAIRLERQEYLAATAAHPMAFALALFALAALVIGWPWLSGRVTIPWDAKAHFLPQIQFLAQSLARGDSPAWAPYRVQRPSADRRPAGDDLLPAVPGAGADRRRAQPVGGGCHRAGLRVPRRRGADAVVPRPGLALGRRADRGAGLQLRGVDGLAHPAHRPGAEPRLSGRWRCCASTGRWHAARSSTALPPASSPPAWCWGATRWRCSASICWRALRSGAC